MPLLVTCSFLVIVFLVNFMYAEFKKRLNALESQLEGMRREIQAFTALERDRHNEIKELLK